MKTYTVVVYEPLAGSDHLDYRAVVYRGAAEGYPSHRTDDPEAGHGFAYTEVEAVQLALEDHLRKTE